MMFVRMLCLMVSVMVKALWPTCVFVGGADMLSVCIMCVHC